MAGNMDKVLVNQECLQIFPNLTTIALPTVLSDYTSFLITFKDNKPKIKMYLLNILILRAISTVTHNMFKNDCKLVHGQTSHTALLQKSKK